MRDVAQIEQLAIMPKLLSVLAEHSGQLINYSGVRKRAEACGSKFVQGLVLYDHDQVVPFGDNMFAAPQSCLRTKA